MQAVDDGMKNKEQDEGKGRGGHATMITCCNPSLHPLWAVVFVNWWFPYIVEFHHHPYHLYTYTYTLLTSQYYFCAMILSSKIASDKQKNDGRQVNKKFRKFDSKYRDYIKKNRDKIGTQTCYDVST